MPRDFDRQCAWEWLEGYVADPLRNYRFRDDDMLAAFVAGLREGMARSTPLGAAQALGRSGGVIGGVMRARKLTPEMRQRIARQGALAANKLRARGNPMGGKPDGVSRGLFS